MTVPAVSRRQRPDRSAYRATPDRRVPTGEVLVVATVGGVAGITAWLMENGSYDSWAAIPVAVGLVVISFPLLRRAARMESDVRIGRLLWWACGLKVIAAIPRYVMAFGVYDGKADSQAYSRIGADLAAQFRDWDFTVDLGRPVQGTGFVEILTGGVFTLTGATTIGGFLVFAWAGFWGLYLLHRAFVRACPDGDHWRYARLVFLLPSLLFWPSSIGKEAWMCLGLGVVAYGAARLLTRARGGLVFIAGGSLMLGMVRPHVAALVGFAVVLAFVVKRPPSSGGNVLAPVGKLVVLCLLGVGLVFAVNQLEDFFGVDDFDREAVETTLSEVTRRTGTAGSAFEPTGGSTTDLSPSRFPEALVGVLFRPFPWEANNLQALVSSAESVFLVGLFVVSWRRILGSLRVLLRTPYVVLCTTYTVLFVYGFSAFSNAGILVRQRVQVLPFVLVLVCLPAIGRREPLTWRSLLGAAAPDAESDDRADPAVV